MRRNEWICFKLAKMEIQEKGEVQWTKESEMQWLGRNHVETVYLVGVATAMAALLTHLILRNYTPSRLAGH